jgi:hypothetical protein
VAERAAGPDRAAAERWFVRHGLPYFVDDIRVRVQRGLRPRRLVWVFGVAVLIAGAVAVPVAALWGWLEALVVGANAAQVWLTGYALVTLRAWVIAVWAARRTFSSLGLLFPLVTRALPLLLLFVTFLFINAEVWQVAATLEGGIMWLTVALFLAITVGFLLVRLPEELAVFDRQLDPEQVARRCEGTPLAGYEGPIETSTAGDRGLVGLQKANLVLMLLVTQLVQVVLLSFSVFVFFVLFGLLVMQPDVVLAWTQQEHLRAVPGFERANWELVQVSTFLAAFSGFYFTVYAVTDDLYRKQFFSSVLRELERAVSARAVYRAIGADQRPSR